jgi:AraC-like DNA-binding protein
MGRCASSCYLPHVADRVEHGWDRFFGGLLRTRRRGAYDLPVLERLRRARLHLEAHAGEPLDLEAMARVACFSKFHFLRLFRQAYGETPARYLAHVRLERARILLETSQMSVTEICLDVGYESLTSFSSAFRRFAGASPQRYRRRWVTVLRSAEGPPVRLPACFLEMYS